METKILRPNSKKEIILPTHQVFEFCCEECQEITKNNSEIRQELESYKKSFNALGDYYYYSFLQFKKKYIFFNKMYSENKDEYDREYVNNVFSYTKTGPKKEKNELCLNGTDQMFHFLKYNDVLTNSNLKLDSGIIDLEGNFYQCNYNNPIVKHNLIALTILQNILIRNKEAVLLLENENDFSINSAVIYLMKYYGYVTYVDFSVTDEIDQRFTPHQQNAIKRLNSEEFYDEYYPIDFKPYQKHLPKYHC